MKKLLVALLLFPVAVMAQQGMHFEHGQSWAEIKAKAKAENKYIFMDCFTTWCGPCRYMSTTIFPMQEVGDYMNAHFINVKVQLDTTANDNDEVKSWYQDGHDIAANYKVRAYPTYLFFSPDGEVVHRAVGSSPAEDFLAKAKNAQEPSKQYYTLLKKYQDGEKEPSFLRQMALAALDAYDMDNANKIADEYLGTQQDLYTKDNIELIKNFTHSSSDKGFDIMLNHPEKVDAVAGKGTASSIVNTIILREEVISKFENDPNSKPDWQSLANGVKAKYPKQSDEVIAKAKVIWYQFTKDWNAYQSAVVAYMSKYGDNVAPNDLNNYAWTVFQNCSDMKCVEKALEWSKRSFADNNEPIYMDTYANLLYRLGKKDEAIAWETKAMDAVSENEKKDYQETINKMKAGEKLWN